jgi:methyltransferase
MASDVWFTLLVAAVGVERIVELVISKRHIAYSKSRGGVEFGLSHYPAMVAVHVGLLVGAVAEVWLLDRLFYPWLGWPMLVLVIAAQGLRWWCIGTLGWQWSTRVVVVPDAPRVTGGPYRWSSHPNYVAVVVEGVALPLVHTAWITATVFSVANAFVLRTRLSVEREALALLAPSPSRSVRP